ncbi:MAG: hypothetical protein HXM38_05200 [Isoptericola variabilis]|uniref:hypothetical protein n=1 Tax=Actinomycetes TaxID=1760 RepID=UPI0006606FA8|nr:MULTISPECIES: hypothetical protein [Actinomycetes]MBF1232376.1 hypothetical protein [Isoptericola variabilis]MBF1253038.1 hypothetical protein [Isoptericola variabilis]MBS6968236.1 hypothetical protein [Actinomyces sp.]MDK7159819.1 hypothetical protein [Pauljensenia sp. UMB3104]
MDFINSLSPARKKILLAAAIALIIALVIVGFVRLTGSSDTDAAASAASGTQSLDDTQSDIPQSVPKTIAPQSGGPANASGSLATDSEAAGQASFVMNTLWDAYADPEQARATDLSSVLTASALEEFDAQALEWTRDGTHATGTPTLEDVHIISDDGAGNITVSACVDSSNVRVLNDAGTALTDDTTMTRALTYFQFVKDGETWKLSGFSFPDDPTC